MAELVSIRKPDGGTLSVKELISLHPKMMCIDFANVLLNEPLYVNKFNRECGTVDEFVHAVLNRWIASVEPPPVSCTWQDLIDCMTKANMDGNEIKKIRQVIMP